MPTTAEVLALIDAMPARYRLVLVLAGLGGLRMGEILGLRLGDVDTLRSAVCIPPDRTGDPRARASRQGP